MELTLVALAAGVGSRYGGLKQLEPIGPNGETLLEYSVYDALRAGFSRLVLVVRPETEALFRDAFNSGMAKRIRISYVHQTLTDLPAGFKPPPERSKPWGTGQAILSASDQVDGAFAVVNADDFYGAKSFSILGRFLNEEGEGDLHCFAMVGFAVGPTLSEAGPVSRGLCRLDDKGHLYSVTEIPKLWKSGDGGMYRDAEDREIMVTSDQLVSMNMWGFNPDLFAELGREFRRFLVRNGQSDRSEFYLPEVIAALIRGCRIQVKVLPHVGRWCGITYPEDKERTVATLSTLVASGEYPPDLWV